MQRKISRLLKSLFSIAVLVTVVNFAYEQLIQSAESENEVSKMLKESVARDPYPFQPNPVTKGLRKRNVEQINNIGRSALPAEGSFLLGNLSNIRSLVTQRNRRRPKRKLRKVIVDPDFIPPLKGQMYPPTTAPTTEKAVVIRPRKTHTKFNSHFTKAPTVTNLSTTTDDPKCPSAKKIYFLKIHKTGSSSVKNLLERYALAHGLKPLLFTNVDTFPDTDMLKHLVPIRSYLALSQNSTIEEILLNEKLLATLQSRAVEENQCDIIDAHTVFNETVIRKLIRGNPKFIASVRHPLAQLKSAAFHFKLYEKLGLDVYSHPLRTFLNNAKRFDKPLEFFYHPEYKISYTRNFMAYSFGFDMSREANSTYVAEFLKYINNTFTLVIIAEEFEESMVILKNKFCWSLRDMMYVEHKQGFYKEKTESVIDLEEQRHQQWTPIDYEIYHMFLERHKNEKRLLGKVFWDDMYQYHHIIMVLTPFCRKICLRAKEIAAYVASLDLGETSEVFDALFEEILRKNVTVYGLNGYNTFIDGDDCVSMGMNDHFLEWILLAKTYPELCFQQNINLLSDLGVVVLSKVNCPDYEAKTLRNGVPYQVFEDPEALMGC